MLSSQINSPPLANIHIPSASQPPIPFDTLLAQSNLPPPGPEHYAARRRLWLHPPALPASQPQPLSPSRVKLEHVLNTPNAVYNDGTWYGEGIEKVWRAIASGRTLKYRLPLNLIIKILHAAWVRDDTWPAGMEAPEPDDVLPQNAENADPQIPQPAVPIYPSQPAIT